MVTGAVVSTKGSEALSSLGKGKQSANSDASMQQQTQEVKPERFRYHCRNGEQSPTAMLGSDRDWYESEDCRGVTGIPAKEWKQDAKALMYADGDGDGAEKK